VDVVATKLGTDLFASVFEATYHETLLSKYAGRLIHLDTSLVEIERYERQLRKAKIKLHKRMEHKKQGVRVAAARRSI
jgi:hypothetical protein